ncbi:MAG: helix-turn-helix domain-containing protein [Streptococcus vestibularis]|uniref:helix-turn-helix domain-containing protein n=1 Tax=Streptococcus vestibularis TaxID=1343 RepID=UPI002904BB13|nr:helix-turn-helix domain-containing protein [Streptococcus vestibularis]MDU1715123.1 helix-turn-helix domain-containing protein [Streptococcus vestibularis]
MKDTHGTIFAKRLKNLRETKNLTQTELAEMLGYKNYTTVSKWESGDSLPRGKELKLLAEIFNISTDYMLGIEKNIKPVSSIEETYNQLEPERQKIVYDTAKEQLAQQNKSSNNVVNINKKKYDTLAAHSPDPDKLFTDEEKLKINQFLDKVDADYDRKQKECKHLFDDESDDKE